MPAWVMAPGDIPPTERPSSTTLPASGVYMPEITLKAVVLPAPLGQSGRVGCGP